MAICKVCHKEIKFILVHLKNNPNCQLDYDMNLLYKESKNIRLLRKKQNERNKYKNCIDFREQKKKNEKNKYNNDKDFRVNKNMKRNAYHCLNKKKCLSRMKQYNKGYKPRRTAERNLKKEIKSNDNFWYITDEAYHLYYHSLGKCDQNTINCGRHTIFQESQGACPKCDGDGKLYSLAGCNKVYCMNATCQISFCNACNMHVPLEPSEDFKHFFICKPLLSGLCPLFKNFNHIKGHCAKALEPSFFRIGEYIGFHVPPSPCKDCRKVEENNQELVDSCLIINKFGHVDKKSCQYQLMMKNGSTEQEVDLYYEKKEFHLFNCDICMPVENKVFLTNLYGPPWLFPKPEFKGARFESLCYLYEHFLDHQLDGKLCLLFEAKVNCCVDTAIANLKSELVKVNDIEMLLGIETIYHSCETFRANHAYNYDEVRNFHKMTEEYSEHKKLIDEDIDCFIKELQRAPKGSFNKKLDTVLKEVREKKTICHKWKISSCRSSNVIAISVLLKRRSNIEHINKVFDEANFVSEWLVNSKKPLSDFPDSNRNERCFCYESASSIFCQFMLDAQLKKKIKRFEHLENCILPGETVWIKRDPFEKKEIDSLMKSYFWKKFKPLFRFCKCKDHICFIRSKNSDVNNDFNKCLTDAEITSILLAEDSSDEDDPDEDSVDEGSLAGESDIEELGDQYESDEARSFSGNESF